MSWFKKINKLPQGEGVCIGTKNFLTKFYRSDFNRDEEYVGESFASDGKINPKSRRYSLEDIYDVGLLLAQYFEYALVEENIEDLYVTKNLTIFRDPRLPKIRKVSSLDIKYGNTYDGNKYKLTSGRYWYKIRYKGELEKGLNELWKKDPRYLKKIEELQPELDRRNREAKNNDRTKE